MTITEALMDAANEDQFDADWYLLEADEDEVVDTTVYDYNADIPAIVQEAAQAICTEYEGLLLTSIAHVADSNTYIAWYNDTTLDTDDDGYTMFREFALEDGLAVDIYGE